MKDKDKPFSEAKVRNWAFQILQALEYMHKHGYFHRDLKPGMIRHCYFSDFLWIYLSGLSAFDCCKILHLLPLRRELIGYQGRDKGCWFWPCKRSALMSTLHRLCLYTLVWCCICSHNVFSFISIYLVYGESGICVIAWPVWVMWGFVVCLGIARLKCSYSLRLTVPL